MGVACSESPDSLFNCQRPLCRAFLVRADRACYSARSAASTTFFIRRPFFQSGPAFAFGREGQPRRSPPPCQQLFFNHRRLFPSGRSVSGPLRAGGANYRQPPLSSTAFFNHRRLFSAPLRPSPARSRREGLATASPPPSQQLFSKPPTPRPATSVPDRDGPSSPSRNPRQQLSFVIFASTRNVAPFRGMRSPLPIMLIQCKINSCTFTIPAPIHRIDTQTACTGSGASWSLSLLKDPLLPPNQTVRPVRQKGASTDTRTKRQRLFATFTHLFSHHQANTSEFQRGAAPHPARASPSTHQGECLPLDPAIASRLSPSTIKSPSIRAGADRGALDLVE